MKAVFYFFGLFALFGCSNEEVAQRVQKERIRPVNPDSLHQQNSLLLALDSAYQSVNLCNVQDMNPAIFVDLKYASTANFMRKRVYKRLNKAYLQKDIAQRLARCQAYLTDLDSTLHLLVYDAVRPVQVQWEMWEALDTIPVRNRVKFVSNPANGSLHNYGAAVDVTICNRYGVPFDMGAGYDDIRPIAYPRLEAHFLSTGELTTAQVKNRQLLRKVMATEQFYSIPTEWWHFNACSRASAKRKYEVLNEEK
jgi:D-alanyl-D-alanine dipeptidase